jgi:thiamine pyrophosphokinase
MGVTMNEQSKGFGQRCDEVINSIRLCRRYYRQVFSVCIMAENEQSVCPECGNSVSTNVLEVLCQ